MCNSELTAMDQTKKLAWRQMCDVFGMKSAGKYRMT